MKPGIYEMTMAEYLRDPCPEPSLSSHVAHALIAESPRHAAFGHPRLNPRPVADEDDKFDIGTAAHALLLENDAAAIEIVNAPTWQTKDAKAARTAAREAGKTPLLAHQHGRVVEMVAALRTQLAEHTERPEPFTDGFPERVLIWREGPAWCRARLDWLHHGAPIIDDYKTTGDANPENWGRRQVYDLGYDLQAAFHSRGLEVVTGTPLSARFRWVVQETAPPYAMSVCALSPEAALLAEKKRRFAVQLWLACLETGRWPGYPDQTCYLALPSYEETRWLAREIAAEANATAGVEAL